MKILVEVRHAHVVLRSVNARESDGVSMRARLRSQLDALLGKPFAFLITYVSTVK
jgi:hypothetical protein